IYQAFNRSQAAPLLLRLAESLGEFAQQLPGRLIHLLLAVTPRCCQGGLPEAKVIGLRPHRGASSNRTWWPRFIDTQFGSQSGSQLGVAAPQGSLSHNANMLPRWWGWRCRLRDGNDSPAQLLERVDAPSGKRAAGPR